MRGGLEGVVAAETVLSTADPKRNMLWMRGVPVPRLVAEYGYEGTIALLWQGFVPDALTREGPDGGAGCGACGGVCRGAGLAGACGRAQDG